jgi:hypothetical protein
LPFRIFMSMIFALIGVGLYAMYTDKTAGDLCRTTGNGLVALAHYVDGPETIVALGSHLIAKSGHSIEDSCSYTHANA